VIVAIDGPAGSGKSTTARRVAERMGWLYFDTGAMYRAVGLAFIDAEQPFSSEAAAGLMPGISIDLDPTPTGLHVLLNREDVTARIRTPEAGKAASMVAVLAEVRGRLVETQRRIARREVEAGRGAVLEGRDIGTVVFPDADVKIFMIAELAARARRRYDELKAITNGDTPSLDVISDELAERDQRDAERALSPLLPAEDAVLLDTTGLSVDEQVEHVLGIISDRQNNTQ
jgi:cytidylate kinase